MNVKDRYAIDIFRLKPGTYEYDMQIDADFFTLFTDSLIDNATGTVHILLDKQESLIRSKLTFAVDIPLVCDRSLREFNHEMKESHAVMFKYGDEEMELDDDVYMITSTTQKIHFDQFIYEWILLAVPMKKVHPELRDDENDENDDVIYQTEGATDSKEASEESIDPRWEKLKNLKNKS